MPRDPYLESRVLAADPVELIHLLYEHAAVQVKLARAALGEHNIAARCQAISKALAVLGELEGSLDHSTGGSISQNLARLYQYMRKRLGEGNLRQDGEALAEVESLMQTLDEGWTAMQHATSVPAALPYYHAEVETAAHSWSA
jgi:flagellar secretion chaperone FliS